MKKLLFIAMTLLAAAAATWYFLRPRDKARDVVPADAVATAVFQPAQLFEALGLTSDEVKELTASLGDLTEAVDMGKPLYAFASKSGLTGVAFNVSDADKLQNAASDFGFSCTEGSGYRWLTNSHAIGCFDANRLLLCGPASEAEQETLRGEMLRLMKQSRQDVPMLDRASRQEGFLRLSASLESLPKAYVPKGFDVSDGCLNASLAIGDKDITLAMSVTDADGKPCAAWPEGAELLKPLSGQLPALLPDSPFAWLCLGVKGEGLLKILRGRPCTSAMLMALNVAFFDADLMLKAIDGDVAVVMPEADFLRKEVLLTAHISNTDFLKDAEEWDTTSTLNGMSLRRRSTADDYVFTYQGDRFYFGVRGETLYIATSERLADLFAEQGARSFPLRLTGGKKEQGARGRYLIGSADLARLVRSYASVALMLGAAPQLYEAVDAVNRLNIKSDALLDFELSLTTKKPVKEIVATLKDK
ncbi:MAG: DUF4836 family protein [Bacteroidaceae bacterium]|nr:DUF4836 family protein [Bacteroidaceae bacterium]